MKQNLEKYLKEKRLKLDVENPDSDLIWEGIRNGIDQNRQKQNNGFWKAAAIFLAILSTTYIIINEKQQSQVVVFSLADISENLGNQEYELQHLVAQKWEKVRTISPEEHRDLQFLYDELNQLDKIYTIYQQDLGNTANNELIIRAMLDHYEKKIKILNRILLETEKQNDHEKTILL